MGKPKKGGFPPSQPIVNFIAIKNGAIDNATIAWGDSVVWTNEDPESYQLALFTNWQTHKTKIWADLGPVNTETANSACEWFLSYLRHYRKRSCCLPRWHVSPGTATATITAQIQSLNRLALEQPAAGMSGLITNLL